MKKIRYEADPYNRLVVKEATGPGSLNRFRRVLDGRFAVDRNNAATYHIKSPLEAEIDTPSQVKLQGTWSLGPDHTLILTLDRKKGMPSGDKLTINGQMLDAKANGLTLAVTTRSRDGSESTYILELTGTWRADARNRLTFHVKRERGTYDILTFGGSWDIDDRHQVVYTYETAQLKRKTRRIHTLGFKGYWDVLDRARVSYVLDANTNSAFDFKTSVGIFADDYIKYEIGTACGRRLRPAKKTLKLFGAWKIVRDVGLAFEARYEDGRMHTIVFTAEARLTDRDTISLRLKDEIGKKDLGIELELSRKILQGDGEAFLRLLKSREESAIYIGAGFGW